MRTAWFVTIAAGSLIASGAAFQQKSRLNPVIHPRYTSMLRVGTITVAFAGLTVVTKLTGSPFVGYWLLLWVVPLLVESV